MLIYSVAFSCTEDQSQVHKLVFCKLLHYMNALYFVFMLDLYLRSCYFIVCLLCVAQKYLYFMMKPEDKLSVVTFKGLHHVDTKTVSADAYLKVLSDPGMPWMQLCW